MKIIYLILFFSYSAYAQTNLFIYDMEAKPKPDDSTYVEHKEFLLENNQKKSVFRTSYEKRSDSLIHTGSFGLGRDKNYEKQIYTIKDLGSGEVYKSFVTTDRKYYLVKIEEPLNWEVQQETFTYTNFKVQKAKVNYGGRSWEAWFTTDVPISDGPYVFKGLPGLIVKIFDTNKEYVFTLKEIKKNANSELYLRKGGIEMNFATFKKLMMNYYQDPYSEQKARNRPIYKEGSDGSAVKYGFYEATKDVQSLVRKYNNPIELNYKNEYE